MTRQLRDANEAAREREEKEAREIEKERDAEHGAQAAESDESKHAQRPAEVIPHVGRPLDGSQYQDVVDEQLWAEKPPTAEEQRRRPTKFDTPSEPTRR